MMDFLQIVHRGAHTPYGTVQTFWGNAKGCGSKDLPTLQILVVLSGRKPWVPVEAGPVARPKQGVGEKGYLCRSYDRLKIIIVKQ